jgi:hypothetical protein
MFHIHIYRARYGFDDVAVYQQCRCGKRRYVQYASAVDVTPVNAAWIKGGTVYENSNIKAPRHDPFLVERW